MSERAVQEARLAAMRAEHEARMVADAMRHHEVMARTRAALESLSQRNREHLLMWIEQTATDEQIVALLNRINRGEL